MKGTKDTKKLLIFIAALAVIFVVITKSTYEKTFEAHKASEQFTELDYYAMQEASDVNAAAVMKALKSGKAENLSGLLTASGSSEGAEALMSYANWEKADFENVIGMGPGSLSPAPDSNGRMDISERFFVDVDGEQYVLFIESVCSRWGRTNDGVSAVVAMPYNHFDELGYAWNGKPDDYTVSVGTLFWPDNQREGEDPDF